MGSLTTLNVGVDGLDKELVPITALAVRVCRYGRDNTFSTLPAHLVASALLDGQAATTFEKATNQLPGNPAEPDCGFPGSSNPFVVTFASKTQRVTVSNYARCDVSDPKPGAPVTNGMLHAQASARWLDELTLHTTKQPKRP